MEIRYSLAIKVWCIAMIFMSSAASNLTLTIATGTLTGAVHQSYEGRPFIAYRGIPYAKPPKDYLRFQPPEPAEPWNGVLDATDDRSECFQPQNNRSITNVVIGDEDCLYLSVYTPQVKSKKLMPVLVHLPGGAFYFGSSKMIGFGPQKFMDLDIVFVTFNYRLGVFGFMSTGDENAYGNYGLLDQVVALKWIRENIDRFGGDPDKVTIFGMSSGATSVLLHMLSPLAKGLFRAAICQSGSFLGPNCIQENPLFWATKIAEMVNCTTNGTRHMVDCLRKKPAAAMVQAANTFLINPLFPLVLLPVVEAPGGSGFLTEDPLLLLKENRIVNRVPLIIGSVRNEGQMVAMLINATLKDTGHDAFFEDVFPKLYLRHLVSVKPPEQSRLKKISKLIEKEYSISKNTFVDGLSEASNEIRM